MKQLQVLFPFIFSLDFQTCFLLSSITIFPSYILQICSSTYFFAHLATYNNLFLFLVFPIVLFHIFLLSSPTSFFTHVCSPLPFVHASTPFVALKNPVYTSTSMNGSFPYTLSRQQERLFHRKKGFQMELKKSVTS